jgi:hypothetical protein
MTIFAKVVEAIFSLKDQQLEGATWQLNMYHGLRQGI